MELETFNATRLDLWQNGVYKKKGEDYEETYAPVARMTTVRILLALISKENLYTLQMDVKNAFLHGVIREEIYMKPSADLIIQESCAN